MNPTLAGDGDLALRRMRNDAADLGLLQAWRRQPHVREFWDNDDEAGDDSVSMAFVEEHYGPLADPESVTVAVFIVLEGTPIGYLQFYPWAAYPSEARETGVEPRDGSFGLDVFIGEPSCVRRGIGSRAVDLACRYLFTERGATEIALLTEVANVGAHRAYEKAGFEKVKKVLDLDTRGGERIESWLMVRRRRAPQLNR